MAHLSSQASVTVVDESWDRFLNLLSELERTSGTALDHPILQNGAASGDACNDSEVVASSRPADPVDKIENRRQIQKRYRAREKVCALHGMQRFTAATQSLEPFLSSRNAPVLRKGYLQRHRRSSSTQRMKSACCKPGYRHSRISCSSNPLVVCLQCHP